MGNSVDPDQMPHSWVSHPGLHCLLRPVCPNTWRYYDTFCLFVFVLFFSQKIKLDISFKLTSLETVWMKCANHIKA